MANQWFRMYAEFATDPKVQMLSESDQRRYIMLLCLRCCNVTVTLQDEEVAFQLRISNDDWQQTKATLIAKKLIDEHANPCGWDKRQYASDSSAERVSRYREKMKRSCNVTVTPPDTDTDTENKEKINKKEVSVFSVKDLMAKGLSEETAKELHAFRKRKKAAITPYVWKHFLKVANELGLSVEDAAREWVLLNSQGFEAQWVRNRKGNKARASPLLHQPGSLSGKNYTEGIKEDGTITF